MRRTILAIASAVLVLACLPSAKAEVLITKAEAALPAPAGSGSVTRAITRGPGVEQLSPSPDKSMASPLPLLIKFVPRNNVPIDPASVKLTYIKSKAIDLTERIKKHVTADGIDMSNAEVPAGTHILRLEVTDQQGRSGTAVIKLIVAER